jgi:hypothetical protein
MNFDELERALAAREKPQPSAALERRVLAALSREAARERRSTFIALAACLCAFVGLAGPAEVRAHEPSTIAVVVPRLFGRGENSTDIAHLPRIAPVRGSSALFSSPEGL